MLFYLFVLFWIKKIELWWYFENTHKKSSELWYQSIKIIFVFMVVCNILKKFKYHVYDNFNSEFVCHQKSTIKFLIIYWNDLSKQIYVCKAFHRFISKNENEIFKLIKKKSKNLIYIIEDIAHNLPLCWKNACVYCDWTIICILVFKSFSF